MPALLQVRVLGQRWHKAVRWSTRDDARRVHACLSAGSAEKLSPRGRSRFRSTNRLERSPPIH